MKTTRIMSLILLSLVFAVRPPESHCQDVIAISPRLAEAITKSGKKTVAVVDFTDLQGRVTEFGRFLAEEFSVALATTPSSFKVIDRTNLKTILQEHKLASTGIIDPQTARKLGEITGVQALVTGTITPFGDSLRISVKVLDSETAEIISGIAADMPRNKAIDELLARGVATGDQPATVPTEKIETEKAQQTTDSATAEMGDFLFLVQGCRLTGNKVDCWGTVTNRGSQSAELRMTDRSYLIDNLGKQSRAPAYQLMHLEFGATGGLRPILEPNLPMSFSLFGEGLSADATSVSIVFTAGKDKTTVRNIRLQHR